MAETSNKIVGLERLAELVAEAKARGEVVGHCHGSFDLVHPGHIKHFQAARRVCDLLVVTVTADRHFNKGPGRPYFPEQIRLDSLAALQTIDNVALNEWPTAVETIALVKPDLYIKGSDYAKPDDDPTGKIVDEVEAVEREGGRLHITHEITFSSTDLLNRNFNVIGAPARDYIQDLKSRWDVQDVLQRLKDLKGLKVLVIGDAILDEYTYTKGLGKASKSPIINSRFLSTEVYAGGALAIGNHIAGFTDDVRMVTVAGDDGNFARVAPVMDENIVLRLVERPNTPTTTKQRFIERFGSTKMFELSYMDDSPLDTATEDEVLSTLDEDMRWADLVLAADFGHGLFTERVISKVREGADFLAVNAQTNSANIGFNLIDRWNGADYISIDENEMRLVARDQHSPIDGMLDDIAERFGFSRFNLTRGVDGATYRVSGEGTWAVPVFSDVVVDSVGAGDAVLSVTSMLACKGVESELLPFIGNSVGALAVQILGNKEPVRPLALFKFITGLMT
jgi:cytidyltransferase-like protein